MLSKENCDKAGKVREILLMPIVCNKSISNIKLDNNTIFSGQKYYSSEDEDMADFSVGFYEIIYGDIVNEMLSNGRLSNSNFAGDTMNSFNSIANLVTETGKTRKERTPKEQWPGFLKEYSVHYHCLANFWILPLDIGRRSGKMNQYDSMGVFLSMLRDNYAVLKKYTDYYLHMSDFDEFCAKHFLPCINRPDKEEIVGKYKDKNAEFIVGQAMRDIENRANVISGDKKVCEKLYKYFNGLGILV